jgi:hypothetical protein
VISDGEYVTIALYNWTCSSEWVGGRTPTYKKSSVFRCNGVLQVMLRDDEGQLVAVFDVLGKAFIR